MAIRLCQTQTGGYAANEFGYAERFNNWIARNKPGNDDSYSSFSPQAEKIDGSAMNRLGASEASPKGAYQG
ncbi:hypothetical protein [Candidatus Spongiihabitans sp.]|uniref:hypothetical protein n=1 Tax=Candidatus Spongiihabitans sp. TaxID=3101308 RepID=UPI003C7C399E